MKTTKSNSSATGFERGLLKLFFFFFTYGQYFVGGGGEQRLHSPPLHFCITPSLDNNKLNGPSTLMR